MSSPAADLATPDTIPLRSMDDRIVTAGCEVFLEVGFALNLKDVALRAQVSRQTVYRRFGHRDALVKLIVKRLLPAAGPERLRTAPDDDLRSVLIAFSEQYLDEALNDRSVALYRVMVGPRESADDGGFVFGEIYNAALNDLAAFIFQTFGERLGGRARSDRVAERFLGSVMGYRRFRRIFGVDEPAAERRLAIEEAVESLIRDLETAGS